MKPSFCIITTTFKRPDKVLRSVQSVQNQSYTNWQHIVVVDDVSSDYSDLISLQKTGSRLTVLSNQSNLGKNASVNLALSLLHSQKFDGYIIFLDDDDWLETDCLAEFEKSITEGNYPWVVSQRENATTGKSFTVNNTSGDKISYQYHCLIKKDFTGDATHCIHFSSTKEVRFPNSVKNAEEWLYFAQVSTIHPHFHYVPISGTLSEGYALEGLTDLYHQNRENSNNALPLLKEVLERQLFSPLILSYVFIRLIRSLV